MLSQRAEHHPVQKIIPRLLFNREIHTQGLLKRLPRELELADVMADLCGEQKHLGRGLGLLHALFNRRHGGRDIAGDELHPAEHQMRLRTPRDEAEDELEVPTTFLRDRVGMAKSRVRRLIPAVLEVKPRDPEH
ncbi:unnamed protein product [Phytomonas sp. Hart1]|nr:unnamed protein product [Phytomonas sp. Hart1]|eukprot:CCW67563.1 unnamed protein product [Phytomonas sp. isolate Hart1]